MPQIDQVMISYASQIVALLLVLSIIYFGIAKAMLPKVQNTIDARAKRVSDDLAAADMAHKRADEIEETYRNQMNDARSDANGVTSTAKAQASAENDKRVAAADEKLDAKLAEAEAALGAARTAALAEIENVAVEATQDIVAKVSGGTVAKADVKKAVKEVMARG